MTDNVVLKGKVRVAISNVDSLKDWNDVREDLTEDVLAQWRLSFPYTGPNAYSKSNEWVHRRDGILKIRYRALVETPVAPRLFRGFLTRTDYSTEYGVRHVVLAATFQNAATLKGFITNRVTEFIENRDQYPMTNGKYNQK